MAKRPTKQQLKPLRGHSSWLVFAPKQELIGTIYDAPDERAAMARAVEEFGIPPNKPGRPAALRVPPNERGRLIAQRKQRGEIQLWRSRQ